MNKKSSSSICIGHLNVYHLYNKCTEVSLLMQKLAPIHLFGISESRLDARITDNLISINDYTVLRRDSGHPLHTGLALYVHKSIENSVRRRLDLETEAIECIWVEINDSKTKPLLVGYVYRNPASSQGWPDDFISMMDKVTECNANNLLLGDFNIDLFKQPPAWNNTTALFGLEQLVEEATRVTKSSATLIDHIYTNNKQQVSNVKVVESGISDHSVIFCHWSIKLPKQNPRGHTTITFRSFKNFNETNFLFDLSLLPFANVCDHSDPDEALSVWYDTIKPVIDKHAPIQHKRVKATKPCPWLTQELISEMKKRDQLKHNRRFDEYKKQRNYVVNLVQKAKNTYFSQLVKDNRDTSSIWKAINSITRKNSKTCDISANNISPDSFNDHFLSVSTKLLHSLKESSGHDSYICSSSLIDFCREKRGPSRAFHIPLLTVYEVGKLITGLTSKKSMGPDNIPTYLLKLAIPYVVDSLTYIYNLCIQKNIFPKIFKTAKVIPLPKNTDRTDPNNFRPISLLSVLSKPLEKHVHRHLSTFMEKHNLFHTFQSGFRSKHSCHTALSAMCDMWLSAVDRSEIVGAVFLDFRKAFDLVDHTILQQKLRVYLNNSSAVRFFQSYLSDRSQYVCANGKFSATGTIQSGVPQGSILGPLLFCIFINDLPLHIQDKKVRNSLFADDSSLDTSGKTVKEIEVTLQKSLNDVSGWCKNNLMCLHPEKTKCMVIATRQKHQRSPLRLKLDIDSKTVVQVKEHRVLGITIDDEFKWQSHVSNICKTVSKNIFLMSQLKRYVSPQTLKMFYSSHILTHVSFSSTVWDGCGETHLNKLNSLHRRAAKLLLPDKNLSTDEKMKALSILPLQKQLYFNKAVLMFKMNRRMTPSYIISLFTESNNRTNRYVLPKPRIDLYKTSLSFSGSACWNSLPVAIKTVGTIKSFKRALHQYLMGE